MSNNDRWGGGNTMNQRLSRIPKPPLQQGLRQTYLPVGKDQSGGNKWDREVSKNYVLSGLFPKVYP